MVQMDFDFAETAFGKVPERLDETRTDWKKQRKTAWGN